MKFMKGKILLVIGSTVLALFLVELSFRVYGALNKIDFRLYTKELTNADRLPKEIYSDFGFKPMAEAIATTSDFSVIYKINSQGLRDKEYAIKKPEGVTRVGVFGDSFTFAEGVPDNKRFTEIAENQIPGVEVLNFGFPGLGLDSITGYIFREAYKYQLDQVVIMLNRYVLRRGAGNYTGLLDFTATEAASLAARVKNNEGTVYLQRDDPLLAYQPGIFLRHSYALSYLNYRYKVWQIRQQLVERDKSFWTKFREKEQEAGYDTVPNTDLTTRTKELLDKVNSICTDIGCKLTAVNIDSEPLEYFYPQTPPFAYYDLSADLKQASQKHSLTFKYDHHYNEQTNELIGEKLAQIIIELVEGKP